MIQGAPINVLDYGAVGDGVIDDTAAIQSAINAGNIIVIPPGAYKMSWAAINADINIPSDRKIIVEKGAIITMTGGRFTADNVTNVEWQIDGKVNSVAMRTAASKPLWTATALERGFIEFGYNYVAGTAGNGFFVHGTGVVSGDFVGTPNVSDVPFQINRKGICCWNAKNVLVSGLEVFGFDGEAIYASFFDVASNNIVFENNNVHNTRFNALNFNNGVNGGNVAIRNNRAVDCYQVEMANGECTGNYIENTASFGIFTGGGNGEGPVTILNNTIVSATGSAIAAVYSALNKATYVSIENNTIIKAGGYSIFVNYCNGVIVQGNTSTESGTLVGSYDIGLNNVLRATVSENTFFSPGSFSQGRIAIDNATCFDVAVSPDNNVFVPTTGTTPPVINNGVSTLSSQASLPIPILGSIFKVSGTSNITSLANVTNSTSNAGRVITLIFEGVLTFTDGSNLKIAGNFVTSADDTITLVCDGTNWYEVSRSIN